MRVPNAVVEVFRKEMLEMLRDKRVRSGAFLMPCVIVLMTLALFGVILGSLSKTSRQKVHVVASKDPLVRSLQNGMDAKIVDSEEQGVRLIREGKARLLVVFDPKPNALGQQVIRVRFDEKEEASNVARAAFSQALRPALMKVADANLRRLNLTRAAIEPVEFREDKVPVGQGKGASGILVSMLPYMIVLFAFTGGFTIAGDLVAGEKEKSTLETLLVAPVRRTHIVLGKFLALALVCTLSAASALTGIYLYAILGLSGSETIFPSGVGINARSAGAIFAVMLPLVAFFASLLLAVSSYARNTREAQTYLGLVNLVVIVPAVFSQVIGFTDLGSQLWIHAVPILNVATNIRLALQGKEALVPILITTATSLVLAAISLKVAVALFNREEVLARI